MGAIRLRHRVPKNEADFELLGLALLKTHWDCPGLELYAHRGEKQFGIDMVDLTGAQPLSAAQCKLHDPWKTIAPAEIKAEVQKARTFRPKLRRHAILTSAKASRAAHDTVLKINQEHRKQDLFQVELMTWGKLETLLDQYDDVRDQFAPAISGRRAREISEKVSAIHEAVTSKPPTQPPAPIPRADAHRFAVAVAHLTHDNSQNLERLIVESIRDLAGVQVLRFDRIISAEGPIPEASERDAHETARALLRQSSAEVLILGTVLSHDGRTAPRLYWTTAESSARSRQPYIPENFQLPELFWDDLVEVLRLLVVTQSAELFARRGKRIAAELRPFVDKVRNLLESGHAARRWSTGATTHVMFILGMALQQLGQQTGSREHLTQSVGYFRNVVSRWPANEFPADWVAAQNGLGVALGALGTLESDSARLLEALAIFRDLIARTDKDNRFQLAWAAAQNNLGNAFRRG
jgi:hypothetical protein